MASTTGVCQCKFMSVSRPVLPLSPPSIGSEYEAAWKSGPRCEREPRQMREEQMSLFFYSTLSPAVIPLCAAVTLFHLTPPPICPLHSLVTPPPPQLSWLHFASAAAKQAAIAQRGGETSIASTVSLLCCSTALPFFLWSIYPLFTDVVLRRLGGGLFFRRDFTSLCSLHSNVPLTSSMLRSGFVCCREKAYSSLWL